MTTKMRVVLQAENGHLQAEVAASRITFQDSRSAHCIEVPVAFFEDVVDTLIEVTGDDTYEKLEAELRGEQTRCVFAEAQVRVLESQLAAMRGLLQPKPAAKFSDTED